MKARLYQGQVTHVRARPIRHAFSYPASFIAVGLAELDDRASASRRLTHNRPSPMWLDDNDYLDPGARPIAAKLDDCMPGFDHSRTVLLTTPRGWLRAFNPLNAYLAHDAAGRLQGFAAEVSNTYGERRLYVLEPRLEDDGSFSARADKALFVSPFHGVRGEYRFHGRLQPERAELSVQLVVDGAPLVSATLSGLGVDLEHAPFSAWAGASLTGALARPRIWRQAVRLRGKGLKFVMKPRPPQDALRLGPAR